MTTDKFRALALAFPGSAEAPHFDRIAFKVAGKRIFASLHELLPDRRTLALTPAQQVEFCQMAGGVSPVANKFGQRGWTTFALADLPADIIRAALEVAYEAAAAAGPGRGGGERS
ncbi:MAG: MmcQ/YjbR family DNA-binding protein [Verrucomicrobiales bacterium]